MLFDCKLSAKWHTRSCVYAYVFSTLSLSYSLPSFSTLVPVPRVSQLSLLANTKFVRVRNRARIVSISQHLVRSVRVSRSFSHPMVRTVYAYVHVSMRMCSLKHNHPLTLLLSRFLSRISPLSLHSCSLSRVSSPLSRLSLTRMQTPRPFVCARAQWFGLCLALIDELFGVWYVPWCVCVWLYLVCARLYPCVCVGCHSLLLALSVLSFGSTYR